MECYVLNGELFPMENGMTISEMLQIQSINPDLGIAVAVNSEIVPKANWENQSIQPDDNVLIIIATQGG